MRALLAIFLVLLMLFAAHRDDDPVPQTSSALLLSDSTITPTPEPTSTPITPTPTPTATPLATTFSGVPREQSAIRAGPGVTYERIGQLRWRDEAVIIERNEVGTWLRVRVERGSDNLYGWVMTGHLELDDDVRFSQVPVNTQLPVADLSNVDGDDLERLYAVPVIPQISDAMRDVYRRGHSLGRHRGVFTKIGDSLSASTAYLDPISRDDHDLGPYDYLAETVAYFGQSLKEPSVASRIGLTMFSVFDPLWVDSDLCEANESPLECEYRRAQPSIAVILFGANGASTTKDYEQQMRKIIETTLERGIIPVLVTSSADPQTKYWSPTIAYNLIQVALAEEYEIPLVNMWAAARGLPQYGLDRDQFHLKHSGWVQFYYAGGHEAYSGISLQNLLTLRTLHEIRLAVGME